VQELPEYKDKVSLELEINTKRRGPRETGFISGQLICKDVTMMTMARDAVEAILRGKHLYQSVLRILIFIHPGSWILQQHENRRGKIFF
jgi:hypothetical protein